MDRRGFLTGSAIAVAATPAVAAIGGGKPNGRRLSTHEQDPSYPEWKRLIAQGRKVTAYLNGVALANCATADENLGYVECAIVDREGGYIFTVDDSVGRTDHFAIKIMYGNVRIVIE